jgi:hypothetical protein
MARYHGAVWKPLPVASNDPPIRPIGFILHVSAVDVPSLFEGFKRRTDGIESHFHIAKDGTIEQYRDTEREADANYKGNSFIVNGERQGFISIETQGLGAGEWTLRQLDSIKKLLKWGQEKHGIPIRKTPGPFSPGTGYHVMWGAPGAWTPVAKSCPGPDRIKQFNDVLVPWMKSTHKKRWLLRGVKRKRRVVTGWAKVKLVRAAWKAKGFEVTVEEKKW